VLSPGCVEKCHPKPGGSKLRAIPIARTLALGADMPAGPYTLEVTVRGRNSKKLEREQ